ncbi:MAG: hypothetical protein Q9187_002886 [Circinaria calcarea]
MKALRLLRWSGSVLSPRTRPCCLARHITLSARLQSTAPALAPQIPDDIPPANIPQPSEYDLRQLPSPPPSRAASSARLAALHARLSLSSRLPLETLARCLVDPTADPDPAFNNSSFAILGNDLLGYYTSEAILCRYPRLPMPVILAAMWAYSGPKTLHAITREWGVELAAEPGGEVDPGLLQCRRVTAGNADIDRSGRRFKDSEGPFGEAPALQSTRSNAEKGGKRDISSRTVYDDYFGEKYGHTEVDYAERPELREQDAAGRRKKGTTAESASTNFVRAVMGAVYLHGGRRAAKAFFQAHILSRHLDVGKMFEFRQPTRDLSRLCAREGFEGPIARITSETGRLSRHPLFVVGVFSGKEKLGEGQGGSKDEARIRAAINAMKGWYLYSPLDVRVPSEMEGTEKTKPWTPVLVDCGEVVV